MGMIPYDVRSTVSRYSSCSEHSKTIHTFRSAKNKGVSSRPMNDICLERLGSQLAYASGDLSRLDILMSSLLLAVSDVLSLTTIYIISSTVLVVLSSTG